MMFQIAYRRLLIAEPTQQSAIADTHLEHRFFKYPYQSRSNCILFQDVEYVR